MLTIQCQSCVDAAEQLTMLRNHLPYITTLKLGFNKKSFNPRIPENLETIKYRQQMLWGIPLVPNDINLQKLCAIYSFLIFPDTYNESGLVHTSDIQCNDMIKHYFFLCWWCEHWHKDIRERSFFSVVLCSCTYVAITT